MTSKNTLVSGARYFISDGEETRELQHVLDHTANSGGSTETVANSIGNVIGSSRTGGGYTINLKCRASHKKWEVEWMRMEDDQVEFRLDIQPSAKVLFQYTGCKVSTTNESGGNGNYSLDITIVATKRKQVDL